MSSGALAGVRVLDLSRVLAGPFCTMLLGDLGAEVIKVERPGEGDPTRRWGPPFRAGQAAYFLAANRSKRSVALDLKHPRGAALLQQLLDRVDVVVHNFPPGVAARLGVDGAQLTRTRPRLIHAALSSYDPDGPDADRPGYDALMQAVGGLMSITGEADGPPVKVGVAVVDLLAGLFLSNAILAALHERQRSGRGQQVAVSLLDALACSLANQAQSFLLCGQLPHRLGAAHPSIVPYQTLACADGELMIAVGNDRQFLRLCQVLGARELATDARFSDNSARVAHRNDLVRLLEQHLRAHPRAYWQTRLDEASVPAGPVNTLAEVFAEDGPAGTITVEHPTVGPLRQPRNPMRLDRTPTRPSRPPPLLGQHTGEVLRELCGLDDETLAGLAAVGAIDLGPAGR